MDDQEEAPSCSCGERCWARGEGYGPCSGGISVTEDYSGFYAHFCEGHGHYEDWTEEDWERRKEASREVRSGEQRDAARDRAF